MTKNALLHCSFPSLSEFHEHWGTLVNSQEEEKYLLSTNWDLIWTLLEELKLQGRELKLPERTLLPVESHFNSNWKSSLKQALLSLLESDYQDLLEKYCLRVFNHSNSRLNFKLMHPEEIKFKNKTFPTITGMRTLYSFLHRKLEILPIFGEIGVKSEPEIYSSWKIASLGEKTKFEYSSNLCQEVEKLEPKLFKSKLQEPEIPSFK